MDLELLKKKQKELVTRQRNILDKAERENRKLSDSEKNMLSELDAEFDSNAQQIQQWENGAETRGRFLNHTGIGQPEPRQNEYRANYSKDATSYRDKFNRYLLYGEKGLSTDEIMSFEDRTIQSRSNRSLYADSDSAGGFLVPEQLATDVIQDLNQVVAIRNLSKKMQIPNASAFAYPTVDTNMGDLEWTAELQTGSNDDTLDFGQRKFYPHPLARRIKVSKKLLRLAPSAESIVRDQFVYKLGTVQENAFCVGDGQNKPLGVFTASANGIDTDRDTTTAAASPTYDDFTKVVKALPVPYQNGATWLVSQEMVARTQRLKSGDGVPLWQPDLITGMPKTLLGFPVVISSFVPATFATGTYVAILGNFNFYLIVDALSMEIQVLTELYAEANQNGYICRAECDANVLLSTAFSRLKIK